MDNRGLDGGVDVEARDDEADKHNEQDKDDGVGYDLEGSAGSGAILMQVWAHCAVVVGDGAQVVFDLVGGFAARRLPHGLFLNGLGLLDGFWGRLWLLGSGGLLLSTVKGGLEIHAAVGAEPDAAGNLLATAVAETRVFLLGRLDVDRVAIGSVGIITNHKRPILVTAHGETLWAHNLAIVHHKFLL